MCSRRKVDSDDASESVLGRLDTPASTCTGRWASPRSTRHGRRLFVAALRETFEEAGLLLSPGMTDPLMREASAAAREGLSFADVLDRFGLELAVSGLAPGRAGSPEDALGDAQALRHRFFVAAVRRAGARA